MNFLHMKLSALILGFALLSGCTRTEQTPTQLPPGFRPDIGPQIVNTNRPTSHASARTPLGKTGFYATVSAKRYPDKLDFSCLITVEHEKPGKNGSNTVCFLRQFPIPGYIDHVKATKDAVLFDSAHRLVTFKLGATNYTYTLPLTQ
jgi:hypothetical protein